MIISHQYRFIFVKTAKTAGTSIEIALSKYCDRDDDIVTPLTPSDEAIRTEKGYRGPRNCLAAWGQYGLRDYARLLFRGRRKLHFYNHMPASEIKDRISPDIWNSYFKFCIERNPWDRAISYYYHRHHHRKHVPPFADFVESGAPLTLKRRGIDLYTINGQVVVDRVCKYENLAEELEAVRQQVGLPEPLELPHAKGGKRKDKRPYQEIIDDATRDKIAAMFRDEIELLGYEF